MPFNQLLFPLLGGYLLINFTYISSYWASRQSKEQLLLASALAGLAMLIVARTIVVVISWSCFGQELHDLVKSVAPYPGIGTAVLALLLCIGFRYWINIVWPREDAGLWLYDTGTYDALERLLMRSVVRSNPAPLAHGWPKELTVRLLSSVPLIRRILAWKSSEIEVELDLPEEDMIEVGSESLVEPALVMLTLRDRKVYVGWVEWLPPMRAGTSAFLQIYPKWSGYRDSDDLSVQATSTYKDIVPADGEMPLLKVIPVGDIASASLYDDSAFLQFTNNSEARCASSPRIGNAAARRSLR